MNKIIIILITITSFVSLFFTPLSVSAGVVYEQNTVETEGIGISGANTWEGQSFTTVYSHSVDAIAVKGYRSTNAGTIIIKLYTSDAGVPDTLLATGTSGTLNTGTSPGDWVKVTMSPEVTLDASTEYCFAVNSPLVQFNIRADSTPSYAGGNIVTSTDNGSSWSEVTNMDLTFKVYGDYKQVAKVYTLPYTNPSIGMFALNGIVTSLGSDTGVHAYIEYGFDTDYGTVADCGMITATGISGGFSYSFQESAFPVGETIHYRAYTVGTNTGTVQGADMTYDTDSEGVARIKTLQPTSITGTTAKFKVFVEDMGDDADADISVDIGSNYSYGTNIPIATAITSPGLYEITDDSLTKATTYHVRAKYDGEGTGVIYGQDLVFTTNDDSKASFINSWTNWFNKFGLFGDAPWWLLLLALMIAVWFPRVCREHTFIPIIADVFLVGIGFVLGIIDIWIIVLLALVSALVIYNVVIKRSEV